MIAARRRAITETYQRLASQLTEATRRRLDQLLEVPPERSVTELVWIRRPASGSVVAQIKDHLARVELLRAVGAERFDVGALNPNRVRHLASLGRRMKAQTLANLRPERRYQILVATVVDELVRLTDEVLDRRLRSSPWLAKTSCRRSAWRVSPLLSWRWMRLRCCSSWR